MSITVRSVVPQDFPQWLELWDGYNEFYGRKGKTALSSEITRKTWERFFDSAEPVHAMVADNDGVLVGLAHYLFHRSTTLIELNCYLQDLFTNESSRGLGIGKSLIHAVYAQAKQAGSTRVYWQTHESNQTAMKLYDQLAEKTGFLIYRSFV